MNGLDREDKFSKEERRNLMRLVWASGARFFREHHRLSEGVANRDKSEQSS